MSTGHKINNSGTWTAETLVPPATGTPTDGDVAEIVTVGQPPQWKRAVGKKLVEHREFSTHYWSNWVYLYDYEAFKITLITRNGVAFAQTGGSNCHLRGFWAGDNDTFGNWNIDFPSGGTITIRGRMNGAQGPPVQSAMTMFLTRNENGLAGRWSLSEHSYMYEGTMMLPGINAFAVGVPDEGHNDSISLEVLGF